MPKARRRVRIKTPPLLFDATQRVIAPIHGNLDGAFLTYWTSTRARVSDNEVMPVHDMLESLGPEKQLTLYVKSDGVSGMASLRLVHLMRRYARRVTVVAHLNCASAATMLALGADT